MTMTDTDLKDGKVVGIAGPVIDVEFPPSSLPELNTALEFEVEIEGVPQTILAEVAQQLGHGRVRAVCLKPTDGLKRGVSVTDTGEYIKVPVGQKTLGRIMDVMGNPVDEAGEIGEDELRSLYLDRLGIPPAHCVNEYGMTELCSQFYDSTLRETGMPSGVKPLRVTRSGFRCAP